MSALLHEIAVLGLAAAGLAAIVRALVPAPWATRRPWGCHLCLSFDGALVLGAFALWSGLAPWRGFPAAFFTLLAATGLSTWLAGQTGLFSAPLDLLDGLAGPGNEGWPLDRREREAGGRK